MHVLVATDGTMDPDKTAEFATTLAGPDGTITVLTVVEINRNLLRDLRELFGERSADLSHQDAEYVGLRPDSGSEVGRDWPGDDEMLARYLSDQLESRAGPLAEALRREGADPDLRVLEGEAAPAIVGLATELGADVICVGSRGRGLFDGLLGRALRGIDRARRAPVPVLIIR